MTELSGKRGRKSKYETHIQPRLEEIRYWARDGLVEQEICRRLGVAVSTFNNYKKDNIELMEALKEGREIADYRMEDSLYMAGRGYEYEEETWEQVELSRPYFDHDTKKFVTHEMRLVKKVKKFQPPSTTAQIFWLKNRKPDVWRDRQSLEHSGSMDINSNIKQLSDEELEAKLKEMDDE